MMNAYKKYFAARDAAERWLEEVVADLKPVGERYMALHRKLKGGYDNFPYSVDTVEERGNQIYVSGEWTRRGCTDRESCYLPKELVYADDAGRENYLRRMQAEIDAAEAEEARKATARERAQYEQLRTKFEGELK